MKFSKDQIQQYKTLGYVVVDCPFERELTDRCNAAVAKVAKRPEDIVQDGKRNHFTLSPQVEDSYWCELDHSLPFLNVILHDEIVELARQLNETDDIYLRNAGINEQAPDRSTGWHRDSDAGPEWVEYMHYFSGATRENGCLRVIPGSHLGPIKPWSEKLDELRKRRGNESEMGTDGWEDVEMPGEISLEAEPHQLIVRCSKIFHATWLNRTTTGRCMSHWLFHPATIDNHRFRFEEYLTEELIDSLTDEQRNTLWLGRDFELDKSYSRERERELGKVSWGVV